MILSPFVLVEILKLFLFSGPPSFILDTIFLGLGEVDCRKGFLFASIMSMDFWRAVFWGLGLRCRLVAVGLTRWFKLKFIIVTPLWFLSWLFRREVLLRVPGCPLKGQPVALLWSIDQESAGYDFFHAVSVCRPRYKCFIRFFLSVYFALPGLSALV
jgi:hypothetical protein